MQPGIHNVFIVTVGYKAYATLRQTARLNRLISATHTAQAGKRTLEVFKTIEKPDYSVLLAPSFWATKDLFAFDRTVNTEKKDKEACLAPKKRP